MVEFRIPSGAQRANTRPDHRRHEPVLHLVGPVTGGDLSSNRPRIDAAAERYLFKISSRFMIWLASMVQAADSASGSASAGFDSPVARSFSASPLFC